MATRCFFRGTNSSDGLVCAGIHRGINDAGLAGGTPNWYPNLIGTVRGTVATAAPLQVAAPTVAGPTNGIEVENFGLPKFEWISLPFAADTTISGTITVNLWALESSMNANAAINCIIQRLDSTGAVVSTIAQTARVTELGTSAAVANFTVTPTSTNMLKGDRFRARVYADDAGTMASGHSATFNYAGNTASSNGDSWIEFTENFSFITADPAGTTLYLTDTAGPAVGANIEKEMWTSIGSGTVSIVTNTTNGFTAPIQWTNSAGGTAVEWYSKQVSAFTLGEVVKLNLFASESSGAADCGIRAELAICNSDGSGAVVWAAASLVSCSALGGSLDFSSIIQGEIPTSAALPIRAYLAGDDTAVTDGQRLRLRLFIDDSCNAMLSGFTATLFYGSSSDPTFITLSQSITEFKPSPPPRRRRYNLMWR